MAVRLSSWIAVLFCLASTSVANEVADQVKLPVTFSFAKKIEVTGERLMLGEVAKCSGAKILCSESYAIDLGPAPKPGKFVYLKKKRLESVLSAEFPKAVVLVDAIETVTVRAKTTKLSRATIADALEQQVKLKFAGFNDLRVSIGKVQISSLPVVRQGDYQLRFPALQKVEDFGSLDYVLRKINGHQTIEGVYGDDRYEKRFNVNADFTVQMLLPVASHNILRGTHLKAQDFAMTWVTLGRSHRRYVSNIKDLIGLRSKRGIGVGEPVLTNQLARPLIVKRGQIVKMHMNRNGVAVSGQLKALEGGGYGQLIKAEYLATKKRIRVRIKDSENVEYHF